MGSKYFDINSRGAESLGVRWGDLKKNASLWIFTSESFEEKAASLACQQAQQNPVMFTETALSKQGQMIEW